MGRGISIVAIGNEVLYGVTSNTNATCIADAFAQRGYLPVTHLVTSDSPEDIFDTLARELRLGRDVITTGGLGPTIDDNTKAVAARLFSRPLVRNKELFAELASRYGETFPTLENQSLQPQGALLFQNTVGTAPGFLLQDEVLFPNARLFVLPGPPHEMKDVLFHQILPKFFKPQSTLTRTFRLIGLGEHDIDPFLRQQQKLFPKLQVGIYPSYELIRVSFSVAKEEDRYVVDEAEEAFLKCFPKEVFITHGQTLEAEVLSLLLERGWTIATAESCTGGGLAARLTAVAGASEIVAGGVIAYRDCIKESVLGVSAGILEKYGAVSTEVTEAMAKGAKTLFGAQVICAVSGFFGPTGGTTEAPIGTVCASFLMPESLVSERFFFHGTREAICEKTIQTLLGRLIRHIRKHPSS